MSKEAMRKEFEAAYRERYGSMPMMWEDSVSGYLSAHAAGAWWAWQASREALVIELPDSVANTGTLTSSAVLAYKRECREAIEAIGARVK